MMTLPRERARTGVRAAARAVPVLALVVLTLLGVGVRRYVFECQQPGYGRPLPFTLESALQYRLVRKAFTGEGLPRHDTALQYPVGVRTFALDTSGAEYAYAALAHLFPAMMVLSERVRWIEVGWFCLGIPLLALWVRLFTRSWTAGLCAAFFYAVSLSSVMRSTGQELSHENTAMPLLIGHLAASARARRAGAGVPWAALSGLLLALALSAWDLVQFYVAMWVTLRAWTWFRAPRGGGEPGERVFAAEALGVLAVALLSPYYRAHGVALSPPFLLAAGLAAAPPVLAAAARRGRPAPPGRARLLALAPLLLLPLGTAYRGSYGHFGALLAAKLRFLNRKPLDPALLDFDQRILWTPALHSATWALAWTVFPCLMVLTAVALVLWLRKPRGRQGAMPGPAHVVFFLAASFAAFVLFVRFHVFVALFAAALGGWVAGEAARSRGIRRVALAVWVAGCGLGEAAHTLRDPARWGRSGVLYREREELQEWLKTHAKGAPVLANFGTSAGVLAYGGCPVILHPKFETEANRRRVERYGTLLFKGTERALRDWAETQGARYLVYALGEFSARRPEYQMRYMVNAMDPPAYAPARRMEFEPDRLAYFRPVWGNAKYRVFRVRLAADEAEAARRVREAREALARGGLDAADRAATKAQQIDPGHPGALEVLRLVGALRAAGFRAGAEGTP